VRRSLDDEVRTAARRLSSEGDGRSALSERRLEELISNALEDQGHQVHRRIRVPVPDWDPVPGATDLVVGSRGAPTAVAELKVSRLGGIPTIAEALWDAYKLAAQVGRSGRDHDVLASVSAAFLLTAAPVDHWQARPRDSWHLVARELFPANRGERFEDSSH
jgi:hypothetical protein